MSNVSSNHRKSFFECAFLVQRSVNQDSWTSSSLQRAVDGRKVLVDVVLAA